MSRVKREQIAQGLAEQKQILRQRRNTIENEQAFIDARNQLQNDYGVDVIGEMIDGVQNSVDLVIWIEDYLNLNVGNNKQ